MTTKPCATKSISNNITLDSENLKIVDYDNKELKHTKHTTKQGRHDKNTTEKSALQRPPYKQTPAQKHAKTRVDTITGKSENGQRRS